MFQNKYGQLRWRICAAMVGIAAAAYANQVVPKSYPHPPSYTNCGTFYKCAIPDHYKDTIDPVCCSIDQTGCEDFKIDEIVCEAGGTLYDNFRFSRGPYPTATCGGGGYPACH